MIWFRSLLFNACFFMLTAITCIVLVPALILPRKITLYGVTFYLWLNSLAEKYILGLTFEVRGREHLPASGSYFAAAKHQSTYETLKMFHLFGDPAIILKKELRRIPLWGWHAWKLDFIFIDRKNREGAMASIIKGAQHIKEQGRPIIIFPQGTRVRAEQTAADKPYKGGIAKMYAATDLPIIPLAMNTGLFWPRGSFRKYPGKVIFEFLPPIEPGLPEKKVVQALEDRIEKASIRLMHEAKTGNPYLQDVAIPALPSDG
jgi:1-acyl-sn-glycerol-3-phosphate acyltransferase